MPFHYVLANLLAEVPGAKAVIFLDDSGEAVDVATTEYSAEELKVFGAYFEIGLRQARTLLEANDFGEPDAVYLRHEGANVHSVCLPDGYFLVLLQSTPASTGLARHHMKIAVADLKRELFS